VTIKKDTLFIEIGTEELPPGNLYQLANSFANGIAKELVAAKLLDSQIKPQVFASPRRLAFLVEAVGICQAEQTIERVGPPEKAAADKEGKPTKVGLGFARSVGVSFDELGRKETGRGSCLYFKTTKPGEKLESLLPEIAQKALESLPIRKRMRWGDKLYGFVRPAHWVIALHGENILPIEIMGIKAGRTTKGHRFHCKDTIEIEHGNQYEKTLKEKGWVIPSFEERKKKVKAEVMTAAQPQGKPELDEELLDEVTGLVEWPKGLLGSFSESFLEAPQECLIYSMKEHQKYFPVLDDQGRLLPWFVTVANLESKDPAKVIEGNEKVITPRLNDAIFFFEKDKKAGLLHFREQLKKVVFQAQLGTVFEKTERVAQLAAMIGDHIGADKNLCIQAGELSKADLTSDMVYEFTELQGIMGRYYSLAAGDPAEVAEAIREQYLPRFAGDEVPTTKVGMAVALADKIDTIIGLFGIGKPPTGSKDPYSLRRAALGVLRIMIENALDLRVSPLFDKAATLYGKKLSNKDAVSDAVQFVLDRFPAKYKEEGRRPDTISAVNAIKIDMPFDFHRRVLAVESFREMPEAESLAAANKRVQNMLKGNDLAKLAGTPEPALLTEPAEKELSDALKGLEKQLEPLIQRGEYTKVLSELAALKKPVDKFFDEIRVMDEDPKIQQNRIILLNNLHGLFFKVADISQLS